MKDHWITIPLEDWEFQNQKIESLKLHIERLEAEITALRDELRTARNEND